MNHTAKLLIPAGLGLAAAAINWVILTAGTQKITFATVKETVEPGQTFELTNAEKLELPAKFAELSKTIVPYSDIGVLSGRKVRRRIEKGDPIFFADTDLGGKWMALDPDEELFLVQLDEVTADPTLLRIGNEINFRVPPLDTETEPPWVGPFRIVAVGSKITNFSENESYGASGDLTVGIAYSTNSKIPNPMQERLIKFCDAQRAGKASLLGIRLADQR